jgi:PAS domain S-box-containing protein
LITQASHTPHQDNAALLSELHETQQRLAVLLATAPMILVSLDLAGTITQAEGKGLDLVGADREGVIGRNLFELLGEDHEVAQRLRLALQGEPQQGFIEAPPGQEWEYRLTPARNLAGAITGVSGSGFDASERRRSEAAVQESAAKSRFLAAISHELRTPLNAILGFNQLLDAESAELSDKQRRYLHHIDVSGRNLLSLVDEVLDLSKVVAGDMEIDVEEIELAVAAASIAEAVRPLAELRGQLLEVEVTAGCLVKADRRRLGQALTNLIANAVKFTPDGGRITVRGRHLGEFVEVAVSDDGIGIPEADQARLFQEFTQLAPGRRAGGTGLGLALTKRLVEAMGGSVGVTSRVGKGSTFTIRVPAVLITSVGCV